MNEIAEALRQRARRFAVRLVKFLRQLPRDPVTTEIVRQLAKSGPAISANYRLLVLIESQIASGSEVEWLYDEARQLRAIFKASLDTARLNYQRHATDRNPDILKSSNPEILKS